MKKIGDKEYNIAKGVNIATEFDKFKDAWFNEKIIRHKMKRIQSKKQIRTLAYVYKYSAASSKKIEKYCDNWKRLW